jgi:hypothetical protein
MKKIRLLTKSLLFLSFFLPFVFVPRCDNKAKEAQFIKDSLTKDSILKDSLAKAGKLGHYLDSLKRITYSTKLKTSETLIIPIDSLATTSDTSKSSHFQSNIEVRENLKSNYIDKVWETLISPTDDSYSGFAVAIIFASAPFAKIKEFEIALLLFLYFPIGYLIVLSTLICQFFKIKIKKHLYLSIVSFILILTFGTTIGIKDLLWGYYIALIINLLDIIVIYISLQKEKPKPHTL